MEFLSRGPHMFGAVFGEEAWVEEAMGATNSELRLFGAPDSVLRIFGAGMIRRRDH